MTNRRRRPGLDRGATPDSRHPPRPGPPVGQSRRRRTHPPAHPHGRAQRPQRTQPQLRHRLRPHPGPRRRRPPGPRTARPPPRHRRPRRHRRRRHPRPAGPPRPPSHRRPLPARHPTPRLRSPAPQPGRTVPADISQVVTVPEAVALARQLLACAAALLTACGLPQPPGIDPRSRGSSARPVADQPRKSRTIRDAHLLPTEGREGAFQKKPLIKTSLPPSSRYLNSPSATSARSATPPRGSSTAPTRPPRRHEPSPR